ncbi:hypothetical protein I551_5361 [Mycobacterium ulcerans str. Harvey]|uniref:Uncharacterized protein n=1 Tax=Mycobacterium ulcerans str. Harvey TaxID=1299332 RepID=A0ABP3A9R8_MYCUL|nr:hypothetical protein I551_5361 [Mycobacterium ulcerans str. Harvey]
MLVATIALARGEAEKVAEEAVESGHIPATMPHRAVTMHFGPPTTTCRPTGCAGRRRVSPNRSNRRAPRH